MYNITDYPDDRLVAKGGVLGVSVGAFEPAFPGDIPVVDLVVVSPHALTGEPLTTSVRMTQAQARDLAIELLRYVVGGA